MEDSFLEEGGASSLVATSGRIHIYGWVIAGFFTIWSTFMSLFLIYKHFRNYTQPNLQRYVVRILLMVPIYSIDSFLSLILRNYSLYFDVLRDCYEAYVIWLFFTLLVNYFDGKEKLEEALEKKEPMKHPFPTCFFPKFKPGAKFLSVCKICILQFALIKPLVTGLIVCCFLTLALSIILYRPSGVGDMYGDGDILNPSKGYLYLTIIDNASITISMYFLVLFGMATKEELAPRKPLYKFLCIKAVIFFSFWQGVLIAILSAPSLHLIHDVGTWTKDQISTGLQDFIICLEMFLVAIAHHWVFSYTEFRNPEKTPFMKAVLSGKVLETTVPLLKNFSDVVNPKHDFDATKEVFRDVIRSPGTQRKIDDSSEIRLSSIDVE